MRVATDVNAACKGSGRGDPGARQPLARSNREREVGIARKRVRGWRGGLRSRSCRQSFAHRLCPPAPGAKVREQRELAPHTSCLRHDNAEFPHHQHDPRHLMPPRDAWCATSPAGVCLPRTASRGWKHHVGVFWLPPNTLAEHPRLTSPSQWMHVSSSTCKAHRNRGIQRANKRSRPRMVSKPFFTGRPECPATLATCAVEDDTVPQCCGAIHM